MDPCRSLVEYIQRLQTKFHIKHGSEREYCYSFCQMKLVYRKRLLLKILVVPLVLATTVFLWITIFTNVRNKLVTFYDLKRATTFSIAPMAILSEDVTLVTAYFNIGHFTKHGGGVKSPKLYKKWMTIFSKIRNPVVAYFDDDHLYKYFLFLRNTGVLSNLTQVHLINRKDLWSFGLLPKIQKIFADPTYPKFSPNTVIPEYSCAMHAKYELVSKTIDSNPFRTKYFAWIDIGLFRGKNASTTQMFRVGLPPNFDTSKVAYTLVYPPVTSAPPSVIFKSNGVWICGCFFIGHKSVLRKWTEHYKKYTLISLENGLMNTDQQVLYAMVIDKNYPLDIRVQTYDGDGTWNPWFHLGYLCREFL